MSYITDIVVVVPTQTLDDVLTQPFSFDAERRQSLTRIDMDGAGGTKVFTDAVYAAACNYLPLDEFKGWITDVLADVDGAVVYLDTEGEIEVFRPDGVIRGDALRRAR